MQIKVQIFVPGLRPPADPSDLKEYLQKTTEFHVDDNIHTQILKCSINPIGPFITVRRALPWPPNNLFLQVSQSGYLPPCS